ncbi:MAG: N-6 DNA methylase [Methylocella sp.]
MNINYVPIFQLGERILNELPINAHSKLAVDALLKEAISICSQQAALRHDLMGRIYHWLLHHAKYLGTYYTSVPSATLLLKLALAANWPQDFGDPVELASFKVADLACGTGTLLMATAQALSDVYIRRRAEQNLTLDIKDMSTLHRALMENVLHGYDVLPSAVHLTASTLAMLAPEVAFVKMNLYVMPLGIDHGIPRLGSLDFLETDEIKTQMALDYSQSETIRTGASSSVIIKAKIPRLDLCVMNPPFVRSVYGNLLFGSLPDERGELQKELSRRTKELGISATAGLGAAFVSLADKRIKLGGRIAFVLPMSLATGEAWGQTRELIASRYHLEVVITSHDAARPNFSENTDLSEVLFVARRLRDKERVASTHYINLWRNPRSIHEALDLSDRVITQMQIAKIDDVGITTIRSPSGKLGEVVTLPAPQGDTNWIGALFAQTQLLRAYRILKEKNSLCLPESQTLCPIPLCRLSELAELGYDARDIFDAFAVNKTGDEWSPYPAFWDHDAKRVTSIAQTSNARLIARTKPLPGRQLKSAEAVWAKAGNILLVSRLRTNTQKVLAVGFSENIIGNTWWSLSCKGLQMRQRTALLLWFNSSISLLFYYGSRSVTQGAWMQMKKPAWASMPVLDVRVLSDEQLIAIAAAYDELASEQLEALANLDHDPNRRRIDDALSTVLGLPSLAPIRELLAREPGLTARDISPHQTQPAPDPNEPDDEDALM